MNGNEKTSLSWPVSVYESCNGFFIADSTKKYTLLRANNLKEEEWLKNREKEREEGRERERESVLEIRRKIYNILTCEQFGLNTFCGEGKRLLTVTH